MKNPLYIVCASSLSLFCAPDSFAENTNHKSGFYVTGKVGASVLQQKNRKYIEHYQDHDFDTGSTYYDTYYGKSGGTHTNPRLGGGIAVGYNFDTHFNVPVRAEIDVMARMKDSSNYLRNHEIRTYPSPGRKTDIEDRVNNKAQLNTFMFNGFYDFKNTSAFTPYLMGGVGLASFKHTAIPSYSYTDYNTMNEVSGYYKGSIKRSHTKNNFAWNAGAGVRYKINEDFNLDVSYRYLGAGKSSLTTFNRPESTYYYSRNEKSKIKVVTQDIMLGLTYNF